MGEKETKRAKKTSKKEAFNKKFQEKVEGKEKLFLIIMFGLCLLSFGGLIYNRFYNEQFENPTFAEVIEELNFEKEEGLGMTKTPSITSIWSQIQKDENSLELVEALQYELTKEKLDTVLIKKLYTKLKLNSK